MQQGTIINLHIARVKGTPSDPVDEATAISAKGLEGDRSCNESNVRQVLFMDKETLDEFGLVPGQIKKTSPPAGWTCPRSNLARSSSSVTSPWKLWANASPAARWTPSARACARR